MMLLAVVGGGLLVSTFLNSRREVLDKGDTRICLLDSDRCRWRQRHEGMAVSSFELAPSRNLKGALLPPGVPHYRL